MRIPIGIHNNKDFLLTVLFGLCATAVVIFGLYAQFYKLGAEPFVDYDEATYAEVTLEGLQNGSPTTLSFLNVPYFRKPPLLFWLTSASTPVFSDIEFATRFPGAAATLLTALLVFAICRVVGTSKWFALLGAAALITTAAWTEFGRDVRFDNLVTFWIVAAFYAALRARTNNRWYWFVGIALAFAVLSKNVIVAFGGVAVLAVALFDKGFSQSLQLLKNTHVWGGMALFFLIAAPWHIHQTIVYGVTFWNSYLGTEVFERAANNLFPGGKNPTAGDYVSHIARLAAPWVQLCAAALLVFALCFKSLAANVRAAYGAALITVVSVLVVMFSAGTKAFGYLMPMYPFISISVALACNEVWKWLEGLQIDREVKMTLRVGLIFVLGTVTLYGAYITRHNALHIDPYYGWELGHAREEYDIARIIREHNTGVAQESRSQYAQLYTYGTYDGLGSILYYSRIPDSVNPYVEIWDETSSRATTSAAFIVTNVTRAELEQNFPGVQFQQRYWGTFASLFEVAD